MKRTALFAALLVASLAASARADDEQPIPAHHTAGPWITIGVGGGVAAVGILSFVGAVKAHADAQSEALAKGCTTSPTVVCPAGVDATNLKTNVDGEHAMNVLGVIFTAVGGAAIVTGIVWHFLERSTPKRAAVAVQPVFGPGAGMLTVVGTF